MADIDHPKTHVEDQKDVELPRKQPLSPQNEGIDPLTESDTLYPRHDDKGDTIKADKAEESAALEALDNPDEAEPTPAEKTTKDQQEVAAKANTPDALLPASDKTAASDTAPGQADTATPDAGEQALPQEPHTDKGNTSPANKTTSKKDKGIH